MFCIWINIYYSMFITVLCIFLCFRLSNLIEGGQIDLVFYVKHVKLLCIIRHLKGFWWRWLWRMRTVNSKVAHLPKCPVFLKCRMITLSQICRGSPGLEIMQHEPNIRSVALKHQPHPEIPWKANLGPHPRPTESQTAVYQDAHAICMHVKVWEA